MHEVVRRAEPKASKGGNPKGSVSRSLLWACHAYRTEAWAPLPCRRPKRQALERQRRVRKERSFPFGCFRMGEDGELLSQKLLPAGRPRETPAVRSHSRAESSVPSSCSRGKCRLWGPAGAAEQSPRRRSLLLAPVPLQAPSWKPLGLKASLLPGSRGSSKTRQLVSSPGGQESIPAVP